MSAQTVCTLRSVQKILFMVQTLQKLIGWTLSTNAPHVSIHYKMYICPFKMYILIYILSNTEVCDKMSSLHLVAVHRWKSRGRRRRSGEVQRASSSTRSGTTPHTSKSTDHTISTLHWGVVMEVRDSGHSAKLTLLACTPDEEAWVLVHCG